MHITHAPLITVEDMQRQIDLEMRMQGLGTEQYRRHVEKAKQKGIEADTSYGTAIAAHNITKVADAIRGFIHEAGSGKPGRRHLAVKKLVGLDPAVVALHTIRVLMDGASRRRLIQSVAITLADRIEDEAKWTFLEDAEKKLFTKVRDQVVQVNNMGHRGRVLDTVLRRAEKEWDSWSKTDKLHLGVKLIELAMDATGLFERSTLAQAKNKTMIHVVATLALSDWIAQKNARCELLTPLHMPCVIPPRDWTSPWNGGYHTNAIPTFPLIKTGNDAYLEELSNRADDMPVVYDTVNALQRTAWKINWPVLEVMRELWDRDLGIAGIPDREDQTTIPCSSCGTPLRMKERHDDHPCFAREEERYRTLRGELNELKLSEKDRRAKVLGELDTMTIHRWKKAAGYQHEKNKISRSKRLQFQRAIWTAEQYEEDQPIYFVYQLDFRGRIYAVSSLHPQGSDQMKGLLTFHRGLPIKDAVAAGWLAIHGANVWGEDKVSLEDRIAWVQANEDRILAAASDPLGDLWWTGADKPWQFLAWCLEWAGFQERGYGFISHMPIALDGSCSGIQHFSAMLRDRVGGEAVNLLPAEVPSDIYQRVWEVVEAQLRLEISTGGSEADLAEQLLDLGGDRKATKRQVMTLPYGSTMYSCREYTEAWMAEARDKRAADDGAFATRFPRRHTPDWAPLVTKLSNLIWHSIGDVVVAARDAMGWLQDCAKVIAAEGLPINWTTPAGLPIQQLYWDTSMRRVKTKIGDAQVFLSLREQTGEVDKKRMKSSVSPNFVHSMDAAHLMLSVATAHDNGIRSFAMIHDSFGTHAANTAMFGACLREAFVSMYEDNDVLAQFREAVEAMVPEERRKKLPPVPTKYDLDLREVRESDFFFA